MPHLINAESKGEKQSREQRKSASSRLSSQQESTEDSAKNHHLRVGVAVKTDLHERGSTVINNIISGTAGGRKFQKKNYTEPIEMKRLWFDVTHLIEKLLNAFD